MSRRRAEAGAGALGYETVGLDRTRTPGEAIGKTGNDFDPKVPNGNLGHFKGHYCYSTEERAAFKCIEYNVDGTKLVVCTKKRAKGQALVRFRALCGFIFTIIGAPGTTAGVSHRNTKQS